MAQKSYVFTVQVTVNSEEAKTLVEKHGYHDVELMLQSKIVKALERSASVVDARAFPQQKWW